MSSLSYQWSVEEFNVESGTVVAQLGSVSKRLKAAASPPVRAVWLIMGGSFRDRWVLSLHACHTCDVGGSRFLDRSHFGFIDQSDKINVSVSVDLPCLHGID